MGSAEDVTGAEHYQRGREYYQTNDPDNALPEFVRALQKSPELTQSTEIIGEWHDCMMFCLKFNQYRPLYLTTSDEMFCAVCEKIYAHLKQGNYRGADGLCKATLLKLPVIKLPETEKRKCHASVLAELAMALFGLIENDSQKNQELASERLRSAIGAQIEALSIDPEVRLTYRMRPRIRN